MSKKQRNRSTDLSPEFQNDASAKSFLASFGLPAICAAAILSVYLLTLAPTIVGGDSGEFITVAYKTGVAHPPGYPLFTILAKIFTLIPIGTIAWRVNLLSACCNVGAAVTLMLAVRRWTGNEWAGVFTAGLFAFSPLVWRYAVVAEVFGLNNLLVALMIYLAVRYQENQEPRLAYLTAFVFGLAMTNHHTSLFIGVPIVAWIFFKRGRTQLWSLKPLATTAACFLVGLVPYVYLPLADRTAPPFSWGHTSTLKGFFVHLLRREYGTLQLGAHKLDTRGNFLLGLSHYLWALPAQLYFIGLILALIGVYFGLRERRTAGLTITTIGALVLYIVIFHALANLPLNDPLFLEVHMRFWQQATLVFCLWAGIGFAALAAFIPESRWRQVEVASVALAVIFGQAATNYAAASQRHNFVIRDYGRGLLDSLPPGSLLWTEGDLMINVLGYLQQCENYRTDIRVVDQEYLKRPWMKRLVNANYPDVTLPGPYYGAPGTAGYDTKQLFDANAGRFRMFMNMDPAFYERDRSWEKDYRFWPFGTVNMIVSNRQGFDAHTYIAESERALPNYDLNVLRSYPIGTWESLLFKDYWGARFNRASFLINYGRAHGNDREMLEAGVAGLQDMVNRFSGSPAVAFKLLGQAYRELAAYDPVNLTYMKSAWSRYVQLSAQSNDPDLPEIRKAINE